MGMTIAEKALARASRQQSVKPGDYVDAHVDRLIFNENFVRMDADARAAGFADGLPRIWDPDKVHVYIEHHQPALHVEHANRQQALRNMVKKYGIKSFHDTSCGVIHQLAVEDHAMPGELAIGNDSHSCAWGALNCVSTAMGEHDMAYAIVFGEIWYKVPETNKVILTGKVPEWNYSKDIILQLAKAHTPGFARYKAIEFAGPSVGQVSIDSRLTLSVQTVELGGKFGLFDYDAVTEEFLLKNRAGVDPGSVTPIAADPDANYHQVVEINLDQLEPLVALPHSLANVVAAKEAKGVRIHQAHVGSCANGRVEDIRVVAKVLKGRKVAAGTRFFVQPASWKVYKQCMHEGLFDTILDAGAQVLAPGCQLCLGMQGAMPDNENCISSCTRNFKGRLANPKAFVYLASPETVAASAVAGHIVDHREVF